MVTTCERAPVRDAWTDEWVCEVCGLAVATPTTGQVAAHLIRCEQKQEGIMSTELSPKLVRPTWNEVRAWHEYFDGEREIEANAKRRWRAGGYDLTREALIERREQGW